MKNGYRKHVLTLLAVWAGTVALGGLAYMLLIIPQVRAHRQQGQQVQQQKQLYEGAVLASQTDTKIKLREEVEQMRNTLDGFMTDAENSANVTFDIGRMASQQALSSFAIKAADEKKIDPLQAELNVLEQDHIEVRFESDWVQFAAFLNALERNRPVVFIDRFRIVRSTDGKSGHKVDMDLAIFVKKKEQT